VARNYVAVCQRILGIRPTYDGPSIHPAISAGWDSFHVTHVLRGITYHIMVTRKGPGNAFSLEVDGRPVSGDVVPFPPAGQVRVEVKVTIQ